MLIISSLQEAHNAFAAHAPNRVISLLSEDEEIPRFDGLPASRHAKLYVKDESCAVSMTNAAKLRAEEIVAIGKEISPSERVLVHCKRGVARSTAAGFILLCAALPNTRERDLLRRIVDAAPHADPCPLLVDYADAMLERDGRMSDALDDLAPPRPVLSAPTTLVQQLH